MLLTKLLIQHFRNIINTKLTFSTDFNFFIGNNGSGKTNLLEAIYLLGHGKSFRQTQTSRIIQHEQATFTLYAELRLNQRMTTIGLSKSRQGENQIKIDGTEGHRIVELAQQLPIQLITPESTILLTGGPKYRRAFIDWGCFHSYPTFFTIWNSLKHLLKQRNAALRQVEHYHQIRHWDQPLIQLTQQITNYRCQYIQSIESELIATSKQFLPEYTLISHFYQGWEKETDYAELLEKNFARDKQLTYTTAGAHKADFQLRVNHIPVDALLSRGQLKLLVCALRLAQGEHLTRQKNSPCIYLIDDFASELDDEKRQLLATRLKSTHSQVFISAIKQQQINNMIDEKDKIFYLNYGKIKITDMG